MTPTFADADELDPCRPPPDRPAITIEEITRDDLAIFRLRRLGKRFGCTIVWTQYPLWKEENYETKAEIDNRPQGTGLPP